MKSPVKVGSTDTQPAAASCAWSPRGLPLSPRGAWLAVPRLESTRHPCPPGTYVRHRTIPRGRSSRHGSCRTPWRVALSWALHRPSWASPASKTQKLRSLFNPSHHWWFHVNEGSQTISQQLVVVPEIAEIEGCIHWVPLVKSTVKTSRFLCNQA